MSYSNYNKTGYNNRPARGGSSYTPTYNSRTVASENRKRSGAKFTTCSDGKGTCVVVSAWKKSYRGPFLTLYATPYKKTKTVVSESGIQYMNYFVRITDHSSMQVTKTSGLFEPDNRRLSIPELNLIVTDAGKGGYFGRRFSSDYKGRKRVVRKK